MRTLVLVLVLYYLFRGPQMIGKAPTWGDSANTG